MTTQPTLTLQRKRGETANPVFPLNQLRAVFSEDKWIMARTRTEVRFVGDSSTVSIKGLENGVLKDWLRVDRGVLINPEYFKTLSKQNGKLQVQLIGGGVYQVSRRNHARVRQCFRDWGGEL